MTYWTPTEQRIAEAIDYDLGTNTEVAINYWESRHALQVRIWTNINGREHDWWYFYPLWYVEDHRETVPLGFDEVNHDHLVEQAVFMAGQEFIWSYKENAASGVASQCKVVDA